MRRLRMSTFISFILKSDCLCRENLKARIRSADVSICEKIWNFPRSGSFVCRESLSEHGPLAYRLFFRGFILNDVPMLNQNSVLNAHNIRGNPIHRSAETAKPPVHDHEVSFGQDRSRFVLQCWRDALDETEKTVAPRRDVSTVLNVVRRPEAFRGCIVALIEECVE